MDYATLKLIWWAVIGVLLIGFALTDGFDMGAAILLPFIGKTDGERRIVVNTVGATWEGNQVWLITAGGAMFAAWPLVYAASFSGFYFAMLLVLFSLFFRPVGSTIAASANTQAGAARGIGHCLSAASFLRWCSASRSAICCKACPSRSIPICASRITAASSRC